MNWRSVWTLMKFEFKHAKYYLLLLVGILGFFVYFILNTAPEYFETGGFFALEFYLIFSLYLPLVLWRHKGFQFQKISTDIWASPFLILLQQLASTKKIIVTYRFAYYLAVYVPIQAMFFLSVYVLTPTFQEQMSVSEYIVFVFIWLCIGVLMYWIQALQDVGAYYSVYYWISLILITPFVVIILTILFYKVYQGGMVHWFVFIATNYPILSMIVSLLCVVVGTMIFKKQVERKIAQFDYY